MRMVMMMVMMTMNHDDDGGDDDDGDGDDDGDDDYSDIQLVCSGNLVFLVFSSIGSVVAGARLLAPRLTLCPHDW